MEQIGGLVSLVGVVLIARPTSFFGGSSGALPATGAGDGFADPGSNVTVPAVSEQRTYGDATPAQRAFAIGIALVGVVGAASAYTTLRWISTRAHPLISVNYFATWCTIVS